MSSALEHAEEALQQGNWLLLHQCLQKLMVADTPEPLSDRTLARLLELTIAVLESGDFQERWEIVKLLPAFGDRAIAPLIEVLQNEDLAIEARWFAARALGSYSQPDVVITLAELLQTAADEELRSIAADALAHVSSPAMGALTELLAQSNTRLLAVRALAHIRRAETIAPLLTVVSDPDPMVRAIAIEALGSFHDPRVPTILLAALHDVDARVRKVAVEGLGFCTNRSPQLNLVSVLPACLQDVDATVCQQAAIALGRLGTDAAVAALFAVLNAPQTTVLLQGEIVGALARIGTAITLEALHQALYRFQQPASISLYRAILTAIGRWETVDCKPQAAQILIEALATPLAAAQPPLRQAIALGLGALGQPSALETLIPLLADEEMTVRLHAIAALKTLDAQTAHQRLEQLAQGNLPAALQQGVAIALQEW